MYRYFHGIILLILLSSPFIKPQHGAYIAPVVKFTSMNGQSATLFGVKAGWIINRTFVIGAAYYALSSDVSQSWVDPVTGASPFIKFTTGGLNFEYVFLSGNLLSASAEMYMGGAGIDLRPKDESKPFTVIYGGDFLIWEPQLNVNLNLNDWFHVSIGVSYRTTSLLDFSPAHDSSGPYFPIKNLRGFTGSLSFILGMY